MKKHGNWKGGIPNCKDCKKKLSRRKNKTGLCHSCLHKNKILSKENHYNWKGGLGECKICSEKLSSYGSRTGYCRECYAKNCSGIFASNWRGGRKNNNGYVMIHAKSHPNCDRDGYVREHRLVMESHIGRFLEKGEVVYHLNRVRDDNRIENLSILSKVEHDRHHAIEDRIRDELGRFI